METSEFNDIINTQIQRSTDVLVTKAGDYAVGGDRLHNFRRAAGLKGITMREALSGMMLKHTVSVYDGTSDAEQRDLDWWNEKITDHINYLLLLQAVVWDEHNESADRAEDFVNQLRQHGVNITEEGGLLAEGVKYSYDPADEAELAVLREKLSAPHPATDENKSLFGNAFVRSTGTRVIAQASMYAEGYLSVTYEDDTQTQLTHSEVVFDNK